MISPLYSMGVSYLSRAIAEGRQAQKAQDAELAGSETGIPPGMPPLAFPKAGGIVDARTSDETAMRGAGGGALGSLAGAPARLGGTPPRGAGGPRPGSAGGTSVLGGLPNTTTQALGANVSVPDPKASDPIGTRPVPDGRPTMVDATGAAVESPTKAITPPVEPSVADVDIEEEIRKLRDRNRAIQPDDAESRRDVERAEWLAVHPTAAPVLPRPTPNDVEGLITLIGAFYGQGAAIGSAAWRSAQERARYEGHRIATEYRRAEEIRAGEIDDLRARARRGAFEAERAAQAKRDANEAETIGLIADSAALKRRIAATPPGPSPEERAETAARKEGIAWAKQAWAGHIADLRRGGRRRDHFVAGLDPRLGLTTEDFPLYGPGAPLADSFPEIKNGMIREDRANAVATRMTPNEFAQLGRIAEAERTGRMTPRQAEVRAGIYGRLGLIHADRGDPELMAAIDARTRLRFGVPPTFTPRPGVTGRIGGGSPRPKAASAAGPRRGASRTIVTEAPRRGPTPRTGGLLPARITGMPNVGVPRPGPSRPRASRTPLSSGNAARP